MAGQAHPRKEQQFAAVQRRDGQQVKDADIDVIYSDDPTPSVVIREQKVVKVIQSEAQQAGSHSQFNPHARQDGGNYGRD